MTLHASWETCMQVKKQQLEADMEKCAGSKLGKEYIKAVCPTTYLAYMQSTSWEIPSWMKLKLESRLPGEILITSDMQMTPSLWQSEEGLKSLLMKVKVESEKASQNKHLKNKDHGIYSHHFIVNRWGSNGNSDRLCFHGLQNHCRWWLQPWN